MEKTALIEITVTPKSSKSLISVEDGHIRVKLHAPPIDGKANEECIRLFAKTLGLPKSSISVVKGEKGRQKLISVGGMSLAEVMERLNR
ncbi:MAG: DUF167 domain-containing protein [Leptospirales bacterium]|nr:DUF167 domain-containing protein [Leptospirales bacterium]